MLSPVATEINRVLLAHENGLSDSQVREILNNRYAYGLEEYAHAINELLAAHRVKLFTHGSSLVYRAVNEEAAAKIEGLE